MIIETLFYYKFVFIMLDEHTNLNLKTSSSKPAISTSPDIHCSLYNIKCCLKIHQNVWLEYFISFYEIIYNCTNNWYFYKNLHLNLSEAIVFVQKPPSPY